MILSPVLLQGSGLSTENSANIKNIVFDFGGVLIDLLPEKVCETFERFGYHDCQNLFKRLEQEKVFDRMDTGEMSPDAFRDTLREITGLPLRDHQIDEAWMAILGRFRPVNFPILKTLKNHYRIFLLSNTNRIHSVQFNDLYKKQTGFDIFEDFEKVFYSHDLESRKPDRIIYERFARAAGIEPRESLFIDDLSWNVEGARSIGFYSFWMNLNVWKDIRPLFLVAESSNFVSPNR